MLKLLYLLVALCVFVAARPKVEPRSAKDSDVTHVVSMTFKKEDDPKPLTIELELFGDIAPKTVRNFLTLIDGKKTAPDGKTKLSYVGSTFHRIIPNFMVQGGDFTHHTGVGGMSIYGDKFEDESFEIKHDFVGALSMANRGPHTNGSQFFITTALTPWLNDRHVVFGRLKQDTPNKNNLTYLESNGTQSGRPKQKITIISTKIISGDTTSARFSVN